MEQKSILIVRGGGDLASGVIHRLYCCGYRVLVLECHKPSAIRRKVSFGEAVFDGTSAVEGVTGRLISDIADAKKSGKRKKFRFWWMKQGNRKKIETSCTDRCNSGKKESWNEQEYGIAYCCTGTGI